MKTCAVIPVYNHGGAIGSVVASVRSHGLHCILVDDGSEPGCAGVLDALAAKDPSGTSLLRLPVNQGKGGAMMAGLREALRQGYSHALQIDADGQHNTSDIPAFLQQSLALPDQLICGCPIYDESVPKGRLYGRYATHIWVWINTLSFAIRDSMCGFRIYPLAPTVALIDSVNIGKRMDFDTEILVRLYWRGMRIVNQPTRVTYPADGVSHFKVWLDNLLISRMHARLFAGMLLRLPILLWHKVRP
ncbi:glycosyltransferase family 2 protein [Parachitinimonas caeni]|uniref:Glycosyltransferase family 2 protein n=1 Tax=Parachitinimonas caeni TaxID=3031301 RepID=A0ABT7DXY4_9NEIS|nr:glycosyltransferase family 2 protein [Parachitinimonas caeni]MDK2124923.1 glycosyltransferase family 2 protein [Parachitinimonas caeni]